MAVSRRWLPIVALALSLTACGDGAGLPAEDEPQREFAARDYCDCMFLNCHDLYHEIWGGDEGNARAECLLEANATPHAVGPATHGDSIECRLFYCENEPSRDCTNAGVQTDVCQ
jgi:hypothetical protein